jgi:hypothetical protein
MKLWLLRPVDGCDLWTPWYDKAFGFVCRGETEDEARALAQAEGGNETGWGKNQPPAWTDPNNSTCVELTADGDAGVIIRDFERT